jgi:hypothetical protein
MVWVVVDLGELVELNIIEEADGERTGRYDAREWSSPQIRTIRLLAVCSRPGPRAHRSCSGQWRTRHTHPRSGPAYRRSANRSTDWARCFRRTDHCGAFGGLRCTHTSSSCRSFCRRPARVVARRRTSCICALLSQSTMRSTNVSISSNSAQGVDFIGLTAPQHHRLPPSLTLLFSALPQQCGFAGAKVSVRKSHTSCRQPTESARPRREVRSVWKCLGEPLRPPWRWYTSVVSIGAAKNRISQ